MIAAPGGDDPVRSRAGVAAALVASLIELGLAACCMWAGWYHTPAGAVAQMVSARVLGRSSVARPLLSYYSAGVYDTGGPTLPATFPAPHDVLTPEGLLGVGARQAVRELSERQRSELAGVLDPGAAAAHADPLAWGPQELTQRIHALSSELGSEEAGMAGLFAGVEAVTFAERRVRDHGDRLTLVDLTREMPPQLADRMAVASRALSLAEAFGLSWPVAPSTRITSPFGMRTHPILGVQKMHTGVDLGIPLGTEVVATGDGVVRRSSEDPINGRVLIIDHGRGVSTAYCHNQRLLVSVGERVTRGQVVSVSGSSGRSTGPHLHYQLELGGVPVDPLLFRGGEHPSVNPGASADE